MIGPRIVCLFLLAITACVQSNAAAIEISESPVLEIPLTAYGESTVHCGLHALRAVANAIDKPAPINSLFADARFMTSTRGSSFSDLVAAANEHQLFTRTVTGITSRELSASTCPALLPIDSQISGYKHWIAYLGQTSDSRFEFYDSDEGIVSKDVVELDVFLNGTCLLVGTSESQVNQAALWVKTTTYLRRLSFLLSTIALALVAARISPASRGGSLLGSGFVIPIIVALTTLLLVSQHPLKSLPELIANRGCWGTTRRREGFYAAILQFIFSIFDLSFKVRRTTMGGFSGFLFGLGWCRAFLEACRLYVSVSACSSLVVRSQAL